MNIFAKCCAKKTPRYLLLFGAGASIPFLNLGTNDITSKLCRLEEWNNILSDYKGIFTTSELSSQFVYKLIGKIKSTNFSWNFEDICHVVDVLSQLQERNIDRNTLHNYSNVIRTLNLCGIIGNISKFSLDIRHLPFLCRCLITSFINDTLPKNLLERQSQFIQYLLQKESDCSIISLNYDDSISQSVQTLGFFNGFTQNGHMDKWAFDASSFYKAKRTVSYLHGHVRFNFGFGEITYSAKNIPLTFQRIEQLHKFDGPTASREDVCGRNFSYNTFVTTGLSKEITLNFPPYNHYYTKFVSDLCKSDILIIIGYSFHDEHINRCLASYLKIRKSNQVVIVDCQKELSLCPCMYSDDFMTNINTAFNLMDVIPDTDGINNINVGAKYAKIYPQITFYNKGYDNFLYDDYKTIISEVLNL